MSTKKNLHMIQSQLVARGIADSRVLAAFEQVQRHCFVPISERDHAYEDRPLSIGFQQTISQPYVVAFMLEQLKLKGSERVLEIGTGSGYQTALLAELVDQVYSVEFFPELAKNAETVLGPTSCDHVHIRRGDGHMGWPEHAPFDVIISAAAPIHIPPVLEEQLTPEGRLILPVGESEQWLVLVQRSAAGTKRQRLLPVRFVPMLSQEG